jgi:hypothetical protein
MKNLHILPTDKPSRLFKIANVFVFDVNGIKYTERYKQLHKYINQNIYITSDEDIMIYDYYTAGVDIFQCLSSAELEDLSIDSYCKKIILSTDQDLIKDGVQAIDDEFLEWFVKNPSCDKVEVVDDWNSPRIDAYEYKIIIPKEEPKQEHSKFLSCCKSLEECHCGKNKETLEEAGVAYAKTVNQNHTSHMLGFHNGAKWQQERSYSEEDLKQAFNVGFNVGYNDETSPSYLTFEKWFEQFKKK